MGKNNTENQYVLAVKNYDELLREIDEGSVYLPGGDMGFYKSLLAGAINKVSKLKELKKFVKKVKADKKEVMHYWEGLLFENYTLILTEYADGDKSLRKLCDGVKIKFVE